MTHTVIISGNPRPGSRTLDAARALLPGAGSPPTETVIELSALAGDLFSPDSEAVTDALAVVAGADTVVVATPSYKGSFTGLLKAFLDRVDAGGWGQIPAIPVVVAASPVHLHRTHDHLASVLAELTGRVAPGLLVAQSDLDGVAELAAQWHASYDDPARGGGAS